MLIEPAQQLPDGLLVGDRFRVEGLIAATRSSELYAVQHELLGYPAILKLSSGTPEGKEAVDRELAALAVLSHPNNVQVLDFGRLPPELGSRSYVVVEHVAGNTLRSLLLKQRRLCPLRSVRICVQVLAALHEAHSRGLVHGDIKPENIMVCTSQSTPDFVKLIDYDVARHPVTVGTSGVHAKPFKVIGTPRYLAPEVASGTAPTQAADLYSLALVLYECVAGQIPFASRDPVQTLYERVNHDPSPITQVVPIHSMLGDLIDKGISRDPAKRYKSAAIWIRALAMLPPEALVPIGCDFDPFVVQESFDTVKAHAASEKPEAPPPGTVPSDPPALLSVGAPSIWLIGGDPALEQSEVRQAIAMLSAKVDVQLLDGDDLSEEFLDSENPPWVVIFGDLTVLLKEQFMRTLSARGEISRMLLSTHLNSDMLRETVNTCGLHCQVVLPSTTEDIVENVERMVDRTRRIRQGYDGLRLAVRDMTIEIAELEGRLQSS